MGFGRGKDEVSDWITREGLPLGYYSRELGNIFCGDLKGKVGGNFWGERAVIPGALSAWIERPVAARLPGLSDLFRRLLLGNPKAAGKPVKRKLTAKTPRVYSGVP